MANNTQPPIASIQKILRFAKSIRKQVALLFAMKPPKRLYKLVAVVRKALNPLKLMIFS